MTTPRALIVIGLVFFGLVQVLSTAAGIYVNWLWFASLELDTVYRTILTSQVGLFIVGLALFLAFFFGNLALADRLSRRTHGVLGMIIAPERSQAQRVPQLIVAAGGLALGVLMAASAGAAWSGFLLFINQTPFGVADPVFGRDVSFFVFELPVMRFAQSWLMTALVLTLLGVVAIYALRLVQPRLPEDGDFGQNNWAPLRAALTFQHPVNAHLAALLVVATLFMAWDYRLAMYEVVYSPSGVVYGATYADVAARLPALWAVLAAAVLAGALLVVGIFRRNFKLPAFGFAVWAAVAVLGLWAYPSFVQRFEVQPSELERERPYIERNIAFTRDAYNLHRIVELESPAEETVHAEDLQANPGTIRNIRLWDPQPLLDTYNQIQTIRLYYDFGDIDVDRYMIDGEYRQVMLSARELSPQKLPAEAQNWVTRRLQFTHGYGIAMSPVNEVSPEGLPNMLVQDVPPRGSIEITRPEIYYGEATNEYVIVGTEAQEFDFPRGDENVYARHEGTGGVPLSSVLRRALFAWQFGDINILISELITDDSRLLFNRQIAHRAQALAPFLLFDNDPYVVVSEGALFWIHDAYTYTFRYPYSQPYTGGLNYIRNSVKVVTSAYDGSIAFYAADLEDPILRTYATVFPTMFQPLEEMPEGLRAHLRYPQDLFRIQADIFGTYHMTDPQVFYNREDTWAIPTEKYFKSTVDMEPYYVITRLPGEVAEEFVLIRPYTPRNRNNMITWLAARSDPENYGAVIAYRYPKDRLVFGPMQIEARIDQDTRISEQLTLWDQAGSNVIRGNMIVLPVGGSNLYVEPIYLQAQGNSLPEMRRVILAVGNQIVMEPTVDAALARLYGQLPVVVQSPPPSNGQNGQGEQPARPQPGQAELTELAQSLQEQYAKIQEEMRSLEAALQRLGTILNNGNDLDGGGSR